MKAFTYLKKAMTNPQILGLLYLNKLFVVTTNASRSSMRVVLMQGHLTTYINKSLRLR